MQRDHETCTVENCNRPHKARGYCPTHYAQFLRGAEIVPEINTRVAKKPEHCTVDGCLKPVQGKGLCGMHRQRILRHGSLEKPSRAGPRASCLLPECGYPVYSNRLCSRHSQKLRKYRGDHGLSKREALEILTNKLKPGAVCEICGEKQTTINGRSRRVHDLYLDHDHETGKLRGFLCNSCNRGLGFFRDSPVIVRKALRYLRKFKT